MVFTYNLGYYRQILAATQWKGGRIKTVSKRKENEKYKKTKAQRKT